MQAVLDARADHPRGIRGRRSLGGREGSDPIHVDLTARMGRYSGEVGGTDYTKRGFEGSTCTCLISGYFFPVVLLVLLAKAGYAHRRTVQLAWSLG